MFALISVQIPRTTSYKSQNNLMELYQFIVEWLRLRKKALQLLSVHAGRCSNFGLTADGGVLVRSNYGADDDRYSKFGAKSITSSQKMSKMAEVDLDMCLSTALKLAREAGAMIKDAFKKKKNVMLKASPIDLVTETDQAVEKFLFSELRKVFPDHSYIGEESVAAGEKVDFTDAPTWIIDPVDGTMNFVHSFPFTCVSIGLTVNKEPVVGVIYNPILDQMYHASKGQGAFLNDEKISASGEQDLSKALVIGEMGTSPIPEKREIVFENARILVGKAHGYRFLGSAALCMCLVAEGATEVYYSFGVYCWDVAAGCIICREAGAVVLDTAGGEFDLLSRRVLCASSAPLGQEVASLLHQYQPPRD